MCMAVCLDVFRNVAKIETILSSKTPERFFYFSYLDVSYLNIQVNCYIIFSNDFNLLHEGLNVHHTARTSTGGEIMNH